MSWWNSGVSASPAVMRHTPTAFWPSPIPPCRERERKSGYGHWCPRPHGPAAGKGWIGGPTVCPAAIDFVSSGIWGQTVQAVDAQQARTWAEAHSQLDKCRTTAAVPPGGETPPPAPAVWPWPPFGPAPLTVPVIVPPFHLLGFGTTVAWMTNHTPPQLYLNLSTQQNAFTKIVNSLCILIVLIYKAKKKFSTMSWAVWEQMGVWERQQNVQPWENSLLLWVWQYQQQKGVSKWQSTTMWDHCCQGVGRRWSRPASGELPDLLCG